MKRSKGIVVPLVAILAAAAVTLPEAGCSVIK